MGEPRFLFPFAAHLWREKYNYAHGKIGQITAAFGIIYVVGAAIAKKRMKQLGPAKHVTESNISNAVAFASWSYFTSDVGTCLSYILFAGGIRKRDGLEVMCLDQGLKRNWGKGETA